jgi:hypothetical protein
MSQGETRVDLDSLHSFFCSALAYSLQITRLTTVLYSVLFLIGGGPARSSYSPPGRCDTTLSPSDTQLRRLRTIRSQRSAPIPRRPVYTSPARHGARSTLLRTFARHCARSTTFSLAPLAPPRRSRLSRPYLIRDLPDQLELVDHVGVLDGVAPAATRQCDHTGPATGRILQQDVDSARLDSTRLRSTPLDSARLHSARLDTAPLPHPLSCLADTRPSPSWRDPLEPCTHSSCDANPHCGLTPILSNACSRLCPVPFAITSAASYTLFLISSLSSMFGNLDVMTPRMTFLSFGTCWSGANPPARGVSYSR